MLPVIVVGIVGNSGCAAAEDFDPGGFSVEISRAPLGKRAADEKNVTIRAFPHAFMDDRFVLSQDQPVLLLLGYNLSTHCLTRDSLDYLRAEIPEGKRPRLLGFPHGLQGNLWTTEPESMAMDILTYFINGYDGQLVYAFPKGYDARYWKALADANTAIAAFEDFPFDGTAAREHRVTPLTPCPAPSPRFLEAPCGGIDVEK